MDNTLMMRIELTMKKKEEFNLVEDFINQWANHPEEHYRAYFQRMREQTAESTSHYLWYPETQETTDKIFYFIPDNRVYTEDTLVEIHKDSIVTYKLPSHTTSETPSDIT